ncbi:MAG: phage tail assembly chaperone [Caulobacter sp.]
MPWPAMLRLAVSLNIGPEAFWRLSLKEWRALTGGDVEVLTRAGLDALRREHPD